MKKLKQTAMAALVGLTFSACGKDNNDVPGPSQPDITTTIASGDSTAIAVKLADFRTNAGNPVNVVPDATGGRREINWDGVPPEFSNNNSFPTDFFNSLDTNAAAGRKRGLIYIPVNAALRVSDNNFRDIDSLFAVQFKPFSKSRIFSSINSNISEIKFKVPGRNIDAYVTSFGVIFSDVDRERATLVEAYQGDKLLGGAYAQPSDKQFSFVGLRVRESKITRIKITAGNAVLKAGIRDGVIQDLVVMDDFIYSEPRKY